MSTKKLIFLIIPTILLITILITHNVDDEKTSNFLGQSYEEINAFSVKFHKEKYYLEKSKKDWFFSDGLRADNIKVSIFLKTLFSASAGNSLCERNECLKNFSLDEKAPILTLMSSSKKTMLKVGKNSVSPFSSYIMDLSSKKVMEVSGFCASMLPQKIDLIERKLFWLKNPEKIKIIRPDREIDFFLEEGEWFSFSWGIKKNFSPQINEVMNSLALRVSKDEKKLSERKLILYYKTQLPEEFYYKCEKEKVLIKAASNPLYSFELPIKEVSILCQ